MIGLWRGRRRKAADLGGLLDAAIPQALAARVLVCVTFHYAPKRLAYLYEVLTTLAGFRVDGLQVVVCTQTTRPAELRLLERMGTGLFDADKALRIRSFPDLDDPYALTWQHKTILKEFLAAEGERFSHFIYLEDDLRLRYESFLYFLAARKMLAGRGLVPGFVRYEYHPDWDGVFATDHPFPQVLDGRVVARAGRSLFVAPNAPYQGLYILDRSLAQEHVDSAAFDLRQSAAIADWGVRERAAMGLTFHNPPPGFGSRFALPLNAQTLVPERCCWVHHLSNSYAVNRDPTDPNSVFASLPIDSVFRST